MLKMSKSFVVRMVVWCVLMFYLVGDFFVFNGPLRRELKSMFPTREEEMAMALEEGICAKVFNGPIYLGQVERRVRENLWRVGRSMERVRAEEMRVLRWVALNDLIDESLVRIKIRVNVEQVPVSEEEVDAEVARFEKRFSSDEELDKALAAQGIESRKELRFRLAARLQQEKYVQQQIGEYLEVNDEEARDWYNMHKKDLAMPERRRVRHIFLATLEHPSDEAKGELEGVLALIEAGKADFAKEAASRSEDEKSRNVGGDLGWMREDRLPKDFAVAVFSMPVNRPALVRTKLGWHIVEVTGIKGSELLPYESMREEVVAAITDSRRRDAIKQYRHQLRLLNHKKVEIYKYVLEQGLED